MYCGTLSTWDPLGGFWWKMATGAREAEKERERGGKYARQDKNGRCEHITSAEEGLQSLKLLPGASVILHDHTAPGGF